MTPRERLITKIAKAGTNDCWPWIGGMGSWGYGSFWLGGRNINASRAAYLLLVGPINEGMVVCHQCDNPACCNPSHLFLGSQGDNVRDCNRKGRAAGTFSSGSHPKHTAKLTQESVERARYLHYSCGMSQSEIARQLGVHSATVSRAVRGENWK